jgi:hypothetical protein
MKAYMAAEVYLHSLLTTATEISGLLPASAASAPVKEPPKVTEYEVGWVPGFVQTQWRKEKFLVRRESNQYSYPLKPIA